MTKAPTNDGGSLTVDDDIEGGVTRGARALVVCPDVRGRRQAQDPEARLQEAKGLADRTVVVRHVLSNSLIPVVTLIALGIPGIFGGAIVTENLFRVNGIGALLITSINNSDTPVVMAITFMFAILTVVFNLVADIFYGVLDPRVRYN